MHSLMATRGAELLVVSVHLATSDRARLRSFLPRARMTVLRLRADADAFREHVTARVSGSAARLAGDDLVDADERHVDQVVATAVAEQAALDASARDDAVLDVSGRTPEEVITEAQALRAS
jgi:hypothetical protein